MSTELYYNSVQYNTQMIVQLCALFIKQHNLLKYTFSVISIPYYVGLEG